jgi:hypothetical protein
LAVFCITGLTINSLAIALGFVAYLVIQVLIEIYPSLKKGIISWTLSY